MVNPATRKRLLSKRLEVTSDAGMVKLHLTAGDLQDIDAGLYRLYVTRTNEEGTDLPVYSNQNNDVALDNVTMTEPSNNVFVSSAFFGNLDSNFKNAQHSVAIYHSTYTGNIKIQASLMQTSPQGDDRHADWFDVVSNVAIAGTSDILHKTFAVNCNWVRVLSYPADANSTISNIHVRN
mgnify:CR=1 FL=1